MTSNNYVVGTCESLCSPSEAQLRKKNKMIHFYEQKILVASFKRSAADKALANAYDLRTPGALMETLEYLFNKIIFHQERPFYFRYDFIFDRCRAVRQEIVIQNFSCCETVKLLEPIVMFLSFSMYRLIGSPVTMFDPKICRQHLQECLTKSLASYDEMDFMHLDGYSLQNRIHLEAIYLMLNLEDPACLQRTLQLSPKLKSSYIIMKAIAVSIYFHQKNFYKSLKNMQELPHLISAIASLSLPRLRKDIFQMFSIAYNSSTLYVTVDFLQRLLLYDELAFLLRDLKDLGIQNVGEENETKVVFKRTKFNSSQSISNTSHQFVEQKLRDYHIPDLILLKTV